MSDNEARLRDGRGGFEDDGDGVIHPLQPDERDLAARLFGNAPCSLRLYATCILIGGLDFAWFCLFGNLSRDPRWSRRLVYPSRICISGSTIARMRQHTGSEAFAITVRARNGTACSGKK